MNKDSKGQIKKVTELLWKLWWFCFYLITAPLVIALIVYFVFEIAYSPIIVQSFSILFFLFSLLVFYKFYDKYRKHTFLKNTKNYPTARVQITFLISILSLILTPILVFITPDKLSFLLFPLISFSILYLLVWYYYYFQPIDFFNETENIFKHPTSFKLYFKQLNNLVVMIYYIAQIFFLSLINVENLTYICYSGIIGNVLFYLLIIKSTKNQRIKIKESIIKNQPFLYDLTIYKRKFVIYNVGLVFYLLIQVPFLIIFNLKGDPFSNGNFFVGSCASLILILFYFKIRIYISFHYNSFLEKYLKEVEVNKIKEDFSKKSPEYQKFNALLSYSLIGLITLIGLLMSNLILALLLLITIHILTYLEENAKYCSLKGIRQVYLINDCIILIILAFEIIPSFWHILTLEYISWDIRLVIFLIIFYFTLELFAKKKYFEKSDIKLVQNIIAIASFSLIIFSIISFISNLEIFNQPELPSQEGIKPFEPVSFVLNLPIIFLNLILIFILSLFSFYVSYSRVFQEKYQKTFFACVSTNFFLIELLLYSLFAFNLFSIPSNLFRIVLLILLNLLPVIFFVFLYLNYIFKIIPLNAFKSYTHYLTWIFIITLFISIFLIFLEDLTVIFLDFLLFSILFHFQVKRGRNLQKISIPKFIILMEINFYAISGELFFLLYFLFSSIFRDFNLEILILIYISTVITSAIINLAFRGKQIFFKNIRVAINLITLFFSSVLISYYSIELNKDTLYILIVPIIFTCSFLYIPLIYILKKDIFFNLIKKAIIINSILLSLSILLLPTIVTLDLIKLEQTIDKITTINFTLYLFYGILLILYLLSKKIKINPKVIETALKTQIIIEVCLTGTTVFYYPYLLLSEMFLVPLILALLFLFIPSVFSYKKGYFNTKVIKTIILGNTFVLSSLFSATPTIVALELFDLGVKIDTIFFISATLIILFGCLKFLEFIARYLKLKELFALCLNFSQIIAWFLFSFSIALIIVFFIGAYKLSILLEISAFFLTVFVFNLYNLTQMTNLNKKIQKYKETVYFKIYKFFEYSQSIVFFGIIFSLSSLIVSLVQMGDILAFLSGELKYFNMVWYFGIFFLSVLILLTISEYLIEIVFSRLIKYLKLISWLIIKTTTSLFLSLLIFPISFNKFFLFFLTFSLLSPISLSYLKKIRTIPEDYQFLIKKLSIYIFIASIPTMYFEWLIAQPFFIENPIIFIAISICNLFLFANFILLRYERVKKSESEFKMYNIFASSFFIFFSSLYLDLLIALIFFIIAFLLIISQRNQNVIFKVACYSSLSFVLYMKIFFTIYDIKLSAILKYIPLGFYIIVYLASIMAVLGGSMVLHLRKNNIFEYFSLNILTSILTYVYIVTYIKIELIYAFSTTLLVLFALTGLFLYRIDDKRYKWFINPCILLLVCNLISWVSYTILFTDPAYFQFNPTLTFTLTLSLTGFAFVFLYKNAPKKFKKQSFSIVFTSIIISFPTFLFLLLISYFPIDIGESIALVIALDYAIFLYFLSIGIYHWKISWDIWKSGWWAWIIFPIVNFVIIYDTFAELDVVSNAIIFFGEKTPFEGSLIISIIIFSALYLPILYTKIKKYFYQIIFAIWGESLFLLYWISQNLFIGNDLLTNLSFLVFAVVLLIPLLYKLRFWKIISIIWLLLTVINVSFLHFLLIMIFLTEFYIYVVISIDILTIGLFLIVYSFFPNIRGGITLLVGYSTVILGIFLFIYSILSLILINLNPVISVNISLIIMAFSLFSSKYLKINQKYVHFIISWVLIVNFSWLTFNTFSLIKGLEIFAFFLAMTVFGGSFFVFNHYKMFKPINEGFPLFIMGIGLSFSISSLMVIFLQGFPFFIIAVFMSVLMVFISMTIIEEYKHLMWYFYPIPLAFIALQFLFSIQKVQLPLNLSFILDAVSSMPILTWMILYLSIFQIIFNIFNLFCKKLKIHVNKGFLKFYKNHIQLKVLNSTCFILNFTYISIFISISTPISLIYKILEFLIIWSILILISFNYIEKWIVNSKYEKIPIILSRIKSLIIFLLYFEISFLLAFLSLNLIAFEFVENALVFLGSLFVATLLDIHSIKMV